MIILIQRRGIFWGIFSKIFNQKQKIYLVFANFRTKIGIKWWNNQKNSLTALQNTLAITAPNTKRSRYLENLFSPKNFSKLKISSICFFKNCLIHSKSFFDTLEKFFFFWKSKKRQKKLIFSGKHWSWKNQFFNFFSFFLTSKKTFRRSEKLFEDQKNFWKIKQILKKHMENFDLWKVFREKIQDPYESFNLLLQHFMYFVWVDEYIGTIYYFYYYFYFVCPWRS